MRSYPREVVTVKRRLVDKSAGLVCEAHKVFLDVANGAEAVWILQTNAAPLEFNFHINADGLFHVKAILVDSIQTAGTGLGILNHDFRIPVGSFTSIQSCSFGNSYSVGSQYYEELVGVGGAGATGGGGTLEEDAWILSSGQIYALVAENISGIIANVSIDADWIALTP